jgi:hypothetical protein
MPGFPVLTTLQPIVGVDFHKAIPPPPPAGPVMTPHVVVWGSGLSQKTGFLWAVASTSKASSPESGVMKPVLVGAGHACGRGHDAGPHPGHIWPNIFLPLIMLGSASKCEFGSSTVKISVSQTQGGSADFGVNVAYVMNLNLDCNDFPLPPTPTGVCFAGNYTGYAGVTLKDVAHGLLQMIADMALTWGVGAICSWAGGKLTKGILSLLGRSATMAAVGTATGLMNDGAGYFASNGRLFVDAWKFMPTAAAYAFKNAPIDQAVGLVGTAIGTFGLGTPIGYAPANAPVGGSAPSTLNSRLSQAIDNMFQ